MIAHAPPQPFAPRASTARGRTIVLGLGNDILADDAVGLLVARALTATLRGDVDVRETAVHGVALMEVLCGYERAILVDAICTRKLPAGTVVTLDGSALCPIVAPSPHYAGIPEMLVLARALGLAFPEHVAIVAIEVEDALTIGGPITPAVRRAIPVACRRVRELAAP